MEKKKRVLVKRAKLTGTAFKEWREFMGWTQVEAADWFGIHPRTYQGWEDGRRRFHRDGMIKERLDKAKRRKKAPSSTDKTLFD